ncbi:uncharacterized protein BO80DRAFT_101694 [Aspergillus ibericus CBS 121593]|uniref:Uncharacterized protein n=1 Tax=Aspergillus ibericus CBS 121593 TaxID=1448316 RepID=A0A395GYD0_9EURO|nr:hypothetical protein BO80DRAFT_101694 [Aspergillus ibericus CBS 121593]RAL00556.1 hypothetical protein BO80DRAFT_101694 [Aspergillus ibericus CBS 121593]
MLLDSLSVTLLDTAIVSCLNGANHRAAIRQRKNHPDSTRLISKLRLFPPTELPRYSASEMEQLEAKLQPPMAPNKSNIYSGRSPSSDYGPSPNPLPVLNRSTTSNHPIITANQLEAARAEAVPSVHTALLTPSHPMVPTSSARLRWCP